MKSSESATSFQDNAACHQGVPSCSCQVLRTKSSLNDLFPSLVTCMATSCLHPIVLAARKLAQLCASGPSRPLSLPMLLRVSMARFGASGKGSLPRALNPFKEAGFPLFGEACEWTKRLSLR